MIDLINFFQNHDYSKMLEDAREADFKSEPLSDMRRSEMLQVLRLASNHIDSRLVYMSAIGKLLVLASEDEKNGIFEKGDFAQIGFFIHEEMEALQGLNGIKEDAEYFLRGREL